MPECPAGIGVAAGQVVAGNVGANEIRVHRDRRTGERGGAAERAGQGAKGHRVLACADTVAAASADEQRCWEIGESVTLRGYEQPTRLACPDAGCPDAGHRPVGRSGLRATARCALTTASSTVPNTTSS